MEAFATFDPMYLIVNSFRGGEIAFGTELFTVYRFLAWNDFYS